jgi:predicted deacylase
MRVKLFGAIGIAALCLAALALFWMHRMGGSSQVPPPSFETSEAGPARTIIGTSVEGRAIEAYTAYTLMDYLSANPTAIPANLRVSVIPSANPDGVFKVVGGEGRFTARDIPLDAAEEEGRFNANGVDLNRNFACKWKPEGVWRSRTVSAGSAPFSEPEARAIRDFVLAEEAAAVVFWHSQANAVYASECEEGILSATRGLMDTYARAAGYPALASFDAYEVNGDAEGWLASIGIPAITVELSTHETIEWEKNLAGVRALFNTADTLFSSEE